MAHVRVVAPGRPEKDIDEKQLVHMYYNGATVRDLARHFGCSTSTISRRLKKLKVKTRKAYWL